MSGTDEAFIKRLRRCARNAASTRIAFLKPSRRVTSTAFGAGPLKKSASGCADQTIVRRIGGGTEASSAAAAPARWALNASEDDSMMLRQILIVADAQATDPMSSGEQIALLARRGQERMLADGEVLYLPGDRYGQRLTWRRGVGAVGTAVARLC
jgi:hypothetical protein